MLTFTMIPLEVDPPIYFLPLYGKVIFKCVTSPLKPELTTLFGNTIFVPITIPNYLFSSHLLHLLAELEVLFHFPLPVRVVTLPSALLFGEQT